MRHLPSHWFGWRSRHKHIGAALAQVVPLMRAAHLRPKDRFKMVAGAIVQPTQTRRWLAFVQGSAVLAEAAQHLPYLYGKIHRTYLDSRLDCRQRVDVLIAHYRRSAELGLEPLVRQALHAPQVLHEGATKSGGSFQVQLTAMREGHHEGELCLRLVFDGQPLFYLNFVFFDDGGQPALLVSRLQGAAGEQARERVRRATREFYGCRPAALLLVAAGQCAQCLSCESVLLMSNRHRIATNWWRRLKISADYDQTWREAGARHRADGLFEMPPQARQNVDYATIASKKRSEVKKKVALLDGMYDGLRQRFGGQMLAPAALSPARP